MAYFVLIHGAWQGAWCWSQIVPRLESRGHQALALDLPSHGEDPTPPEKVGLQDYVQAVVGCVEELDAPPILVGHSMGAVVVAQVAEQIPDRIRAIVSVASSEPPDGASMLQMVGGSAPEYLSELVWSPDRRTASITPAGVRNFFYNLCSPDVTDQAISRFKPQAVAPYEAAIRITQERYGRVPRFYIGCGQDRVVGRELQRRMCNGLPGDRIFSIDADHSPFFSAPEELTACLERVAQSL